MSSNVNKQNRFIQMSFTNFGLGKKNALKYVQSYYRSSSFYDTPIVAFVILLSTNMDW